MEKKRKFFNVELLCDPETVRKRYLELIHEYPPERSPEEFRLIQAEYELLSKPRDTMTTLMHNTLPDPPSWDDVRAELESMNESVRLPTKAILALGKELS